MNCSDARKLLDTHDRDLGGTGVGEHLSECELCRHYAESRSLERYLAPLREQPMPREGFMQQAAEKAMQAAESSEPAQWPRMASAVAAALLISVVGFMGVEYGRHNPQPQLANNTASLGAESELEYVNVVIHSAEASPDAMVAVALWGDVELVGYPGEVELVWETKLLKGANLLKLPVKRIGENGGQVTVTSVIAGSSQQVELTIAGSSDRQGVLDRLGNCASDYPAGLYSSYRQAAAPPCDAVTVQS